MKGKRYTTENQIPFNYGAAFVTFCTSNSLNFCRWLVNNSDGVHAQPLAKLSEQPF